MIDRNCNSCRFFNESQCKKLPPVVVVVTDSYAYAGCENTNVMAETRFPNVNETDWCGGWGKK